MREQILKRPALPANLQVYFLTQDHFINYMFFGVSLIVINRISC